MICFNVLLDMTSFNYSFSETLYAWKNALCWGNCFEHCKKASKETEVGNSLEGPRFIHIGQAHRLPFNIPPTSEYVEEMVQSQLRVAQEIRKFPDCPVLLEGLSENMEAYSSQSCTALIAKKIFPQGIPSTMQEVTSCQKDFIYENGAVFTMWYLGEIRSLYKTIHEEISSAIDREVEADSIAGNIAKILPRVVLPREIECLSCVQEVLAEQQSRMQNSSTVLVVFGAYHDFLPLCKEAGYSHEKVETTIRGRGGLVRMGSGRSLSLDSEESDIPSAWSNNNERFIRSALFTG